MNPGFAQGSTQTVRLPAGGRISGLSFIGSGPYGSHDPYLSRNPANPYTNGAASMGLGPGGVPSMFGGGSTGGTLSALGVAGAFQGAHNAAKDANEARYASIDGSYGDRETRVRGIVDGMNKSLVGDVNREWDEQRVRALAPFNKSLGSNQSSVIAQLERNSAEGRSAALARAYDTMARTKLMAEDFNKDRLDFQERRNDTYPDPSRMDRLLSAGGDADGGGGGAPTSPTGATPWGGRMMAPTAVSPRMRGPSLGQLRNMKKKTQPLVAAGVNSAANAFKGAATMASGKLVDFFMRGKSRNLIAGGGGNDMMTGSGANDRI